MDKTQAIGVVRDAVRKHYRLGRFEAPDSHFTTETVEAGVMRCHLNIDTGDTTWETSIEEVTVLRYSGGALPGHWAAKFNAMPLLTNNPGLSVAPEPDGNGLAIDFIPDYERTMRERST